MQFFVCVISITGMAGHLGLSATIKILQKILFWKDMAENLHSLVRDFLHYISKTETGRTSRSFGPSISLMNLNDLLHLDYTLYQGKLFPFDKGRLKCILLAELIS